jgi:hypothetical protein
VTDEGLLRLLLGRFRLVHLGNTVGIYAQVSNCFSIAAVFAREYVRDFLEVTVECSQVSGSDAVAAFEEVGHIGLVSSPAQVVVAGVDLHAQHEGNIGKHTMNGGIDPAL